jgi:hypothetical protein
MKSRKAAGGTHSSDLLSLTDGYAFDLELQTYCRITSKSAIKHQVIAT